MTVSTDETSWARTVSCVIQPSVAASASAPFHAATAKSVATLRRSSNDPLSLLLLQPATCSVVREHLHLAVGSAEQHDLIGLA